MPLSATSRVFLFGLLISSLFGLSRVHAGQEYELVEDFFQLPDGPVLGPLSGVAIDSQGRVIVGHRGPRPVLVFNEKGKLLHACT